MKQTAAHPTGGRLRLAAAAVGSLLVLTSSAFAQGGNGLGSGAKTSPCMVETIRMNIVTGGDDLRGGQDNLNVTIRWGTNGFQGAANVNNGARWENGSTHLVGIRLNQPVPLSEIKSISLDHLANGGLTVSATTVLSPIGVLSGLQTADNWDMASLEVTAVGSGVGALIVRHGPKRFTGSDPVLNIRANVPPNPCGGNSGSGGGLLNPGNRIGGSGPLLNPGIARGIATNRGPSAAGRTPAKLTPQQLKAIIAKVHNAKPKLGPVVSNPAAHQGNVSALGVLQQQKQVAMAERNQGAPAGSAPPRTMQTASLARMPAMRAPVSTAATPGPSTGMTRLAAMPAQGSNITVACAAFHTPSIAAVSGQPGSSAVFTQDPQYNLVTIRGCNFGQGKGQAQLNSANGRKIVNLTIDTWTDTLITAEVPTTLSGVLDQDNVSLVLFPTSGPQAQRSGYHFYARRAEAYLGSIPASEATLVPISDDGGSPVGPKFSSPYTSASNAPTKTSASGGVDRVNEVRFPGGTDVFDFSKLKPGFSIEKFQLQQLSATCGDGESAYTDGNWDSQLSGNAIRVTWQEHHCHDSGFGMVSGYDYSNASYGLDVWVIGPVLSPGESPWQDGVN